MFQNVFEFPRRQTEFKNCHFEVCSIQEPPFSQVDLEIESIALKLRLGVFLLFSQF